MEKNCRMNSDSIFKTPVLVEPPEHIWEGERNLKAGQRCRWKAEEEYGGGGGGWLCVNIVGRKWSYWQVMSWCGWSSFVTSNSRERKEEAESVRFTKRGSGCAASFLFFYFLLRKPAVLWRHCETLKSVQERPVPSSYSDVVVVEQQVKDDTCEGNWASVHAASQPCDPQWGAFPWCGAQTFGLHGSSYQWWMTVSVLLLIKNGY